tara:strand:+ start:179 stop:337 length:159 start_codon:yes stop_codon:yes gene_type:complete
MLHVPKRFKPNLVTHFRAIKEWDEPESNSTLNPSLTPVIGLTNQIIRVFNLR